MMVYQVFLQRMARIRCFAAELPLSQLLGAQVSMPVARVEGLPVGLSFIGPAGSDERLLELAESLVAVLAA